MQIYSVAKNVLGALGPKVKVPVLDSELKIPAECLRIVGALASGAIIESGSNANGRYIKYADNTMICTQVANLGTMTVSQNDGASVNWIYPAQFIDTKDLCLIAQPTGWASNRFVASLYPNTTSYAYGECFAITGTWNLTGETYLVQIAIGRWKA